MYKKSLSLIAILCFCVGAVFLSKGNPFITGRSRMVTTNNTGIESFYTSDVTTTETISDADRYINYVNVSATDQMPALCFEITGRKETDDYIKNSPRFLYYPDKIVITADDTIIQQLDFDENDFAPCTMDAFGFEYGDFRFDGYGGFRILSTSMGKNPSYYFWVWDKDRNQFVSYPDLEMVGYIDFDYDNQEVKVFSTGGGDLHEFLTYKYINDKLTMIEKVIDADQDDKRKVYKVIDGELRLIEITESQLK